MPTPALALADSSLLAWSAAPSPGRSPVALKLLVALRLTEALRDWTLGVMEAVGVAVRLVL